MRYLANMFMLFLSMTVYSQTNNSRISMAILNVNKNIDATINDKVVFTIKPNQDFIYDFETHNVFLQNKQAGYIPDSLVKRTNKPFFKFNCSKSSFKIDTANELNEACLKRNIKIQPIIDSIVDYKSESEFKRYLNLRQYMDGAAGEMYVEILFNLINSFNDEKLYHFLSNQNESFLKDFCTTITSEHLTWPIIKIDEYYKSYYPKSWMIIKKYE
jgi:hypothetical protein